MHIKTLIRQLEEPYRSQALAIIKAKGIAYSHAGKPSIAQCNKQHEAVALAICWDDSPQGYEYWSDFHTSLIRKENDPERKSS